MIECQHCRQALPETAFAPIRGTKRSMGRKRSCLGCKYKNNQAALKRAEAVNPWRVRCQRISSRAKSNNIPCDLDEQYLAFIWTGICPVLKTPMRFGSDKDHEDYPQLDRVVPERGYVKGNVRWLSKKANRLKSNLTLADVKNLLTYLTVYRDNEDAIEEYFSIE